MKNRPKTGQLARFLSIFLLGICLGVFSKYLDYRQGELPYLLGIVDRMLDFHNFLGGFAPWILIAVWISVRSRTPFWAAAGVFAFFAGMVPGYYLYCSLVAGFFPRSYAMIWFGLTALSPFLAYLCWYARGKGALALFLSAGITGFLINTAFAYGMFYVDVRSWLNVLMLVLGVYVLRRPAKEMTAMVGGGIVFAVLMDWILPFHIW